MTLSTQSHVETGKDQLKAADTKSEINTWLTFWEIFFFPLFPIES